MVIAQGQAHATAAVIVERQQVDAAGKRPVARGALGREDVVEGVGFGDAGYGRAESVAILVDRREPILHRQAGHPTKFRLIAGGDNQFMGDRVRRDQEIIPTDRRACVFQPGSDLGVLLVGGRVERQGGQGAQDGVQLLGQSCRALLGGAEAQFRGYDDAGADVGFSALGDAVTDAACRMAHEIGDDVRVEQISGACHHGRRLECNRIGRLIVDVR
jgi:hypothetical protein